MKKFPHLVQMHRTHAADGLVCMSVNTVDVEPADREKALTFLKEKGAAFPNFVLKDTEPNAEKWDERYPTAPTPLLMLFDRKGDRVKAYEEPPADEELEAEVKRLLAER